MDALIELDQRIFLFLNALGSSTYDGFWMMMTNILSNVVVYVLCSIYIYRVFGLKTVLIVLLLVGLLILVTDQTTNFFKISVGRLRPCYEPELDGLVRLVKKTCGGRYGFFSGHASNSFALASFFGFILRNRLKYVSLILLVIATLIAYSRVYIGVHYPIDIIVGTMVGMLFGYIFYRLYKTIAFRFIGKQISR